MVQSSGQANERQVFLLNPAALDSMKQRIGGNDPAVRAAWEKLKNRADEALLEGPFSVMQKSAVPPSGDKHDYMSVGPYWWPNPNTADGLPYIRRDGETNPERNLTDRPQIGKLSANVETLSLAYFYSGHEPYAAKAASLLRTWFIDEETRMNPNLNYGQAIPGICDGRGIGIIDTKGLVNVVDAIGLLQGSPSWTEDDQSAVKAWFAEYADWLQQSEHGRDEASQANNHGTHYDVQLAVYCLFTGKMDVAERILTTSTVERLGRQIEPDGRQPLELARTKAFGYSYMNLRGWFELATLAERFGFDLWRYRTEDGRELRAALDYLTPYFIEPDNWPYPQIAPIGHDERGADLLRRAASAYGEPVYEHMIEQLPVEGTYRTNLKFPTYET